MAHPIRAPIHIRQPGQCVQDAILHGLLREHYVPINGLY